MSDYFSSEDEEDTLAEGEEEEETQSGDDFCLNSDSEDEPMDTRRGKFSKRDALEVLKENEGDSGKASETVLKMLVNDDMEQLSSQAEVKKERLESKIEYKLRRLAKDDKSRKFRHKQEELDNTFEHASQSSLVELIKSEKGEMREEDEIVKGREQKKHRKPLHKSTIETAKKNTESLLETVKQEANELMTSPTALLAFLIYRLNYVKRRSFAVKMLRVFREDEWEEEQVGREKALALLENRNRT